MIAIIIEDQRVAERLVAAGRLACAPNAFMLSLRMIDTETTAIPIALAGRKASKQQKTFWIEAFAKDVLARLKKHFPLRGYVAGVSDSDLILNIGSKQGAVIGAKLEVLEEGAEIEFGGKLLGRESRKIGEITITRTQPGFSYARVDSSEKAPTKGNKVQEVI